MGGATLSWFRFGKIRILSGGGQKLAAVRLLRYWNHIFSEKGTQLF